MNWEEYKKIIFDKCKERQIPYHVSFELTPFCNFRCNMCYIRLDPEQAKAQGVSLSTDDWINIAKEAKKLGAVSLEITGGEAITRSDFCLLYRTFIKMGFLIILRSNGYLISGDVLELLKQYKPRSICITLYGASDETYKRVCGVSDGYTVVTNNIIAMKNAGLRVQLSMTMTKDNVNDLDALKDWSDLNGLSFKAFGGLFKPLSGTNRSINHLKIDVFDEEYNTDKEFDVKDRVVPDKDRYLNPFWMCRGFGAVCSISWDGNVRLCNSMATISMDLRSSNLKKAYQALYDELYKIRKPKECKDCQVIDFCNACPMRFCSETGNPEQTCEEICKIARKRYQMYLMNNENDKNIRKVVNVCEEGDIEN